MTKQSRRFVAYYRVSTDRQGKSGLGLAAQEHAVASYIGASGNLIAAFTEVESGKRNDRPELAKAIAHAKAAAKLDRLARNVHFVSGLMEAKVDFVAADNPTATKFTVHILAAVAEHGARDDQCPHQGRPRRRQGARGGARQSPPCRG